MSRWFRFYDEALNDPKVQMLPADDFKSWVNLLCLASQNDGRINDVRTAAFALHRDQDEMLECIERLRANGLISRDRQGRYELVMLKRGRVSEPRVRRNSITPRLRSKILSRRRCAYCGTTQGPFHVEHIHPIARGGSNAPSNLECACVPCNMSKGSKLLSEWMRAGK